MSRAVRRQQRAAPKDNPKATGTGAAVTKQPRLARGARTNAAAAPKRRLKLGRPSWFEDVVSELKKVSWPTFQEARYLTVVVIIVAVLVGTLLGTVDIFFNWLIDHLLLR